MTLVFSANQALLRGRRRGDLRLLLHGPPRRHLGRLGPGRRGDRRVLPGRRGDLADHRRVGAPPEHVDRRRPARLRDRDDPGQGAAPDARASADDAGAERFRKPTGSRAPSSANGCGTWSPSAPPRRAASRAAGPGGPAVARRQGYPARAAMAQKLAELHLADLHELAAELGVPRFRLLRRDELVDEIEARRAAPASWWCRAGAGAGRPSRSESQSPSRSRSRSGARAGRGTSRSRERERLEDGGDRGGHRSPRDHPAALRVPAAERARDEPRRRLRLGFPGPPLRAAPRRRGLRAGALAAPRRAPPRAGPRRSR